MRILGIETSCDETAAAVVEDGREILSNVVVSQIDIFAEYGGVIPEVAARSHLEVMMPVIEKALKDAGCEWGEIDAIAVTYAPGLIGSLLIGTLTARVLAILHEKPLYAVHHLKAHVYANWVTMKVAEFPLLALVVSGGHTQILYMRGHNQFEVVGGTRDDAVGECFDKVAKVLGLPYPGGPSIAKAAEKGDAYRYPLPHPKVEGLDFSFSGLKTAVLREVQRQVGVGVKYPSHKLKELLTEQQVRDMAASFQRTAVEILCEKMEKTLKKYPEVRSVVVAGGVSANQALRQVLTSRLGPRPVGPPSEAQPHPKWRSPWAAGVNSRQPKLRNAPSRNTNASLTDITPQSTTVYFPAPALSGDNGVMVAVAAYYEIMSGVKETDPYALDIYPRISVEQG